MPTSTDTSAMELTRQRPMRVWKGLIFIALAAVLALELPGRVIYHLMKAQCSSDTVAGSRYPKSLHEPLVHDFDAPKTRMQYEFDRFSGWRAKPAQPGLPSRDQSTGRQASHASDHLSTRLIFLTGGRAAWSLGASDNEHTVSAYLERSINQALPGKERVQVLNIAEQAYGMRQESMTILDHLDMKPELVIFYDGVDDLETILSGKESQRYRPYRQFPEIIEATLQQITASAFGSTSHDWRDLSMTWRVARRLMHFISQRWHSQGQPAPSHLSAEQQQQIKHFFRRQMTLNHRILDAIGVKSLFVLQPISYVDQPIPGREPVSRYERQWLQEAYEILEQEYKSIQAENIVTLSLAQAFHHTERQVSSAAGYMNDLENQIMGEFLAQKVIELLTHN